MDEPRTMPELLAELNRWRVRAARGTGTARVSLRALSAATGHPHNTLSSYLSGRTLIPVDVLDSIVQALGATPAQARQWAQWWEAATLAQTEAAAASPPPPPETRTVPRLLPADVSAFTGREAQLEALDELLEQLGDHAAGSAAGSPTGTPAGEGPVVIAAVSGTAGVGKTALAVHWAHRVAAAFPDGQLYVDLHGYGPGDPTAPGPALELLLQALVKRPLVLSCRWVNQPESCSS